MPDHSGEQWRRRWARYPKVRAALLTLLVSGGWLVLYVADESGRGTPTALMLAILIGTPIAVWQIRSFNDRANRR